VIINNSSEKKRNVNALQTLEYS